MTHIIWEIIRYNLYHKYYLKKILLLCESFFVLNLSYIEVRSDFSSRWPISEKLNYRNLFFELIYFKFIFYKLKLSQNTVDYLNLWYYSKRKISIDRLEIMIFQEFVKWGASFSMVISSEFRMGSIETITIKKMHPTLFLGIDYWKLKVSIRNYLPPQYLAASKIFTWNFIF